MRLGGHYEESRFQKTEPPLLRRTHSRPSNGVSGYDEISKCGRKQITRKRMGSIERECLRSPAYLLKLLARWATISVSISLLAFAAAGTLQISSLRNYLATFATFLLATMMSVDPGLARERSCGAEKGTPGRFAAGLLFLATLALAAFEVGRLHFFRPVPPAMRVGGLVAFAVAMALNMWAMIVNPFFSPDIRLQEERGHRVITGGPYRLVRHPGYLAMLLSVPASALAIGSWLALAPAMGFCRVILKRVVAEEIFLDTNLAGYHDYSRQVRGRLLPRAAICHDPLRLSVASKLVEPGAEARRR